MERGDEEAEAGEECRICRIAVRRSIAYGIGCDDEIQMACLLRKRSYVLENQNTLSSEAIMSDLTRTGDYELLEKQKEGYETN